MSLFEILQPVLIYFHLIAINSFKKFSMKSPYRICSPKSSAQFWGVTAKQGTNGIGDNVQVYDIYESSLKPCSYYKQFNAKIWSLQYVHYF